MAFFPLSSCYVPAISARKMVEKKNNICIGGGGVGGGKQKNKKCTNIEIIRLKKYVIANHSIMDPDAQENQHLLLLNVVKCNLT